MSDRTRQPCSRSDHKPLQVGSHQGVLTHIWRAEQHGYYENVLRSRLAQCGSLSLHGHSSGVLRMVAFYLHVLGKPKHIPTINLSGSFSQTVCRPTRNSQTKCLLGRETTFVSHCKSS